MKRDILCNNKECSMATVRGRAASTDKRGMAWTDKEKGEFVISTYQQQSSENCPRMNSI